MGFVLAAEATGFGASGSLKLESLLGILQLST